MVREISHVKFQNKYIILNRRTSKGKRELNMQAKVKTKNGKNLKVKALVDSRCTHTGIDNWSRRRKSKPRRSTSLLKYSTQMEQRTER